MAAFEDMMREEIRDLPVYVPGKPINAVKRELGLENVIKLASNENSWGPSPKVKDAINHCWQDLARYPEPSGYELRQALAAKHHVPPDHFIFGNGSDEIVQMIASAFFKPGEEVLMGTPSFPRYPTVTQFIGAIPIEVPLRDGYYPLEDMAAQVSSRTKAIFICNPNNPSGTARSMVDIEKFVASIPSHILLIFDEAYFEYMDEPVSGTRFLNSDRPVIVLRTFSKAYGLASLRIGYAIAHPDLIQGLEKVRCPFNVNSLAFAAALAALEDQDYLEQVVQKTKVERAKLSHALEQLGVKVLPSQTNFIMAYFPIPASELSAKLLQRGIIVRGAGEPHALRITVGTSEENERLLSEIKTILSKK